MPASKVRTKKKPQVRKSPSAIAREQKAEELVYDFLAEVASGIKPGEFSLLNLLYPTHDGLKEHYYILSRNKVTQRLEEHTDGESFKKRFARALKVAPELDAPRMVIGFFDPEEVKTTTEGIEFHKPKLAFKWVIEKGTLVPESKPLNWNGFDVQPGFVAQ